MKQTELKVKVDVRHNRRYALPISIPFISIMFFLLAAAAVLSGITLNLDQTILISLRNNGNLSVPVYSSWLFPFMMIITSLGNEVSLTLMTIIITIYLVIKRNYRDAIVLVAVVLSGSLLDFLLKSAFARTRPVIVPHLTAAYFYSFPSGHAFVTTVLFSSAGFIFLKKVNRKIIKNLTVSIISIVLLLIGFSRIYLGVHFPSDILGGWSIGIFWFSFVWIFSEKIGKYPLRKGR